MKKFLGIMLLGFVIVLSGCSLNQGYLSKKASANKTSMTKTAYYQKLGEQEKKKVSFSFTIDPDETKDTVADYSYVVSMKVTNHGQKNLKFDQSKFIYLLPDDKVYSEKSGILLVKKGQTKTVNQLFEDIPEQGTLGQGILEYLNRDNELAFAEFKDGKASSKNLSNSNLIEQNKNVTGNSTDTDTSSNDESEDDTTTDDTSSDTTTSGDESRSMTEGEARSILINKLPSPDDYDGYHFQDLDITQTSEGDWEFTNPDGECWTVYSDGTVEFP